MKLPNGVGNFEEIIKDDYYYIDKTMYIEKIEEYSNKKIIFLRPRKFGKTLFTSTLENYYDVLKKDIFDELFGKLYIGKNPTKLRNKYHILKFNFSGIDTNSIDSTIKSFRNEVSSSIRIFVEKYKMDFFVNGEDDAETILDNLIKAFYIQKPGEKIYCIIDEYDHFANELLGFNFDGFKDLISKNGKVRKWYEILKKGTESVVDRIFITGVAPITLDSMTSGFNIASDITQDVEFNEMMGFTEKELVSMLNYFEIPKANQELILPIMKENYDGYMFTNDGKERMYNSNMTLYFLNEFLRKGSIPEKLIDVNIASDYSKLANMLRLCITRGNIEIPKKIIMGEDVINSIVQKFNPEINFGEREMISMLYYLGYLTIKGKIANFSNLGIPNRVMKEIYLEYFLEIIDEQIGRVKYTDYGTMAYELMKSGDISGIVELMGMYLTNLSNRDFIKFDEKYVKIIFYSIVMNMKDAYYIKSEPEIERNYPDILMICRDDKKKYYSILIEFKYLKKDEASKLEEKRKEAIEQVKRYSDYEEIKGIENLRKYAVVAVNDNIYVDEIK